MGRTPQFCALIILGVLAVLIGLVVGIVSPNIVYQNVGQRGIAHYLSSDGTGYLQLTNGPTLFVINEKDFTPTINGINTFADGDTISLVYQTNDTTDIDVKSSIGTHLVGSAFRVVEITRTDTNGQQIFTTPNYSQHPQGFSQNNWGIGIGIIIVGLLLIGGSFFLPRKKPQAGFSITQGAVGFPQPFQQSNQGVPQYPPTQYSGQADYQSPTVPYQQPSQYSDHQPQAGDPTQTARPYDNPYQQPPQK